MVRMQFLLQLWNDTEPCLCEFLNVSQIWNECFSTSSISETVPELSETGEVSSLTDIYHKSSFWNVFSAKLFGQCIADYCDVSW